MTRSSFITSERSDENPILIVDRSGVLGNLLLKQLKDESLVVFVSQKKPEILDNVVHIPFVKKIPTVPDNTYSHIFIIDDETKATRDSLPSFIKKAQNDRGVFLFATHIKNLNEKYIQGILSAYEKAKVLIYGDLFFKDLILEKETTINKFIYEAQTSLKINIPGDGTRTTYPVFAEDLVDGVFEAVFGGGQNRNLFYLFPKHGVTNITLAHMIQKIEPSISIDFVKEKKSEQQNYVFYPEGFYLLGEYNLEDKIKKIELSKKEVTAPSPKYKNEEKRGRMVLPFFWLLFCVAFFISLPLITTLLFSFLGLESLKSAKSAVDLGNIKEAQKNITLADNFLNLAKGSSIILYSEGQLIGQPNVFGKIDSDINTGKNVSSAGVYLLNAYSSLSKALSGNPSQASSNFNNASNNLKNAIVIFEKEKATGSNISNLTEKIDPLITFASNTINVWPDLLGYNGKKTYMLLFQNNMELRPGGGFIGSYGLLTVENGKISDFKVYDVYDADGQLKGHVEPPFAIRRYLGSVHWYLRDSNFNVNYVDSAAQAANFLNIEKGEMVNGVIGVDLSFVRNVLTSIGEVYVPEYNEKVNADNVFQLTESHAEKNFFPGSTQKKDFLRSLISAIQNKVFSQKISYLSLARAVGDSISQKHILFAFDDNSIQNLFTVNGWSSSLWDDRQTTFSSVNDFVGISEANLGINKENYFIRRSQSQVVNIDDKGNVVGDITVAYKNTNTNGIWPGGIYKNYLRFILPLGANLTSVKINGQTQTTVDAITNPQIYENKNFVPPSKLEVERYDQEGKTIYGFLVMVPVGGLETISIGYSLPNQVSTSSPEMMYDLRIFKQPGTDEYPFDFSLTYPSSFKVIQKSEGDDGDGRITYSTNLNSDKEISVDLVKK